MSNATLSNFRSPRDGSGFGTELRSPISGCVSPETVSTKMGERNSISKFNLENLGGFSIVTNLIFIKVNSQLMKEMENLKEKLRQEIKEELKAEMKQEMKQEMFEELLKLVQNMIRSQLKERLDVERAEWIV